MTCRTCPTPENRSHSGCQRYEGAHASADEYEKEFAPYDADIAFDIMMFKGTYPDLPKETWDDIRECVVKSLRGAYLAGFYHGWDKSRAG